MYMYQDSLCVSRLPPVSLEAQVNMVSRARARAAVGDGGEKIRMQQLFKGRLRGGRRERVTNEAHIGPVGPIVSARRSFTGPP